MNKEQLREYRRKRMKEWRMKNPERNKELRKKYKQSEKGKEANKKYNRSPKRKEWQQEYFRKHPEKFNQSRKYIRDYMKVYLKKRENHDKYLIRQRDYLHLRKKLIELFKECLVCGAKNNLEMHHRDYYNPESIMILCRSCHRQLHRKENQTGGYKNE